MNDTHAPPAIGLGDHERAWRMVAAVWEHDGSLFDTIVAATIDEGREGVVALLAALSRNLVVRLRMDIGNEAFDQLIGDELRACAAEKAR